MNSAIYASCCAFALGLVIAGSAANAEPAPPVQSTDKVPYPRNLDALRKTVETLRGKKFQRDVPAFTVSEEEMRSIVDRELSKDYPGGELGAYQALMIWLDMLPPGTDLRAVAKDLFVGDTAGFYDSDTKEMCIPAVAAGQTKAGKNPAKTEVERLASFNDDFTFAHEFTHALEDQYWPLDDPDEKAREESTDRGTARSFLAEGTATRLMIEAVPSLLEREHSGTYALVWNAIHSGIGELGLDYTFEQLWKSPDVMVPGVAEPLARAEAMPYSYGYAFCSDVMRNWGLDGLDYICDHLPASSAQIIHPQKAWEWREFPVRITLPEELAPGWKRTTGECLGEAGISVILGCSFKNLGRGEYLARGWNGDRAALYEGPKGGHLLVWASSWDSQAAARRFSGSWVKQRQTLHQASATHKSNGWVEWTQPDGRAGILLQTGRQVVVVETDQPEALAETTSWSKAITFAQPPQYATRAAENPALLRFNPLFSSQKDADYTVSKTLWGAVSRHDRNNVGAADSLVLGLLGESHRTASFNQWELGWSLVANHESDSRRGVSKTAVLPLGILYHRLSAKLPQDPNLTLSHASVLWGLAASQAKDSSGRRALKILPAGLLFRSESSHARTAVHVLGTGIARTKPTSTTSGTTRFRLLGIPLWTTHSAPIGGGHQSDPK